MQTCREAAAQMGQQTEALPVRGGSIIKTYSISAVVAIPNIGGYKTANGGVSTHLNAQLVLMACRHARKLRCRW